MNKCHLCSYYREERDINYFECVADETVEEIDKYWNTDVKCPFFVLDAGLEDEGRYRMFGGLE